MSTPLLHEGCTYIKPSWLMFAAGMLLGFLSLHFVIQSNVSTGWMRMTPGSTKHGGTWAPEHTAWNTSSKKTRLLCWVMTAPKTLQTRSQHVKETWARHCDKVLYMSSQKTDFPTVGLNVSEGRENLPWKTIRAFQYIHQNHFDEADWFLKADDDTFVVVENLLYLLSKFDPEEAVYLGRRFRPFVSQGYMSGGAGYVLSKEALRRFIAGVSRGNCTNSSINEDIVMGRCMEVMKVQPADSRDVKGRETFHAFPPDHYVVPQLTKPKPWFLVYDYYPADQGPGCCSDFAVSFHYITAVELYVLDYLTYHLRPFGYKYRFNPDEAPQSVTGTHEKLPGH